ncbi:mitochondrial inner membrane protease ATP23-like [Bidens hawaiensis]|uniref:mitochondrial inner membrane protease ATP23-like n=1 Tax=Bidens hawaiensis TaxID=980011 RepID=UPI004049C985
MSAESDSVPAPGNNFWSATKRGMTVEECENMIQRSLRNPTVKFLREHLEKSGCKIAPNFIKVVNCKQRIAGGYVRGKGIVVCSNHLTIQDEVTQVVIYELIKAYDDCRAANLDWADCAHHACSEIRANHLSGDCHYKRELLRGYFNIRGHEQECVRRRVMKALASNPYCSKAATKDAMEVVWDTCYNDTKPFDRAP